MVTINKASVADNVWKTIYDRLNSDVSSVTANVQYTDGTYIHKVQSITETFSDKEKTQKSDYPILVINPITLGDLDYTFGKKFRNITITIEIFATANVVADKLMDSVVESIETYRDNLTEFGIRNVILEDTDFDTFTDRGGIKLHNRTITFSGRVIYDSTRTY
ncbi:MAG: hypothetical protein ACOCZ5_00645 [bacterium]